MRFGAARVSLFGGLLLLGWLAWPGLAPAEAPASDLRGQLRALASDHGFVIKGLDRLGDEAAKPVHGTLLKQVERLLERYDYVLFHDAGGGIAELWIRNLKQATAPPRRTDEYTVNTTRRGRHHLVQADLVGPGSVRLRASLIVDTGATTIVLPSSMIKWLGFVRGELRKGWALTANGRVAIWHGTLVSVTIGDAVAHDVVVSFIADRRLGGQALLGMSFLGRYLVTLDRTGEQLILKTR